MSEEAMERSGASMMMVPIVNYNPQVQVVKEKDDKKKIEDVKEGQAFKKV